MSIKDRASVSASLKGGGVNVEDVFSTYVYEGTGTDLDIVNGIDLAADGGMVWTKSRTDGTRYHALVDTERGTDVYLASNNALGNDSCLNDMLSFNSDGYSLGNPHTVNWFNNSADDYTSWTFKNHSRFFTQMEVSHTNGATTVVSLSELEEVGMVTVKATDTTSNWYTWHRSLTAGNNLKLNLTDAQSTTNAYISVSGTDMTISSSAPTATYIVYAWAHNS
jgi:hypothetical protein